MDDSIRLGSSAGTRRCQAVIGMAVLLAALAMPPTTLANSPPNDGFADAQTIPTITHDTGFETSLDLTEATIESGEPIPSCVSSAAGSVWYKYTSIEDQNLVLEWSGSASAVAYYLGSGLGSLTEAECYAGSPGTGGFGLGPGTAIYVQVVSGSTPGPGQLSLRHGPWLEASLSRWDPSVFDTVTFAASWGGGDLIAGPNWSFGDGAMATGASVDHRYAADGDYFWEVSVTFPGNYGTTGTTIQVRTHDIAVSRLSAPRTASAGQTRTVTVALSNRRYPETVLVTLLRSSGSGFEPVADVTVDVPAVAGGRTTSVAVPYTFTSADATAGSVVFLATAWPIGVRDAQPADNEAMAPPTRLR